MTRIVLALLLPLVASVGVRRSTFLSTQASAGASFGPQDCVSVERSSTGTCVLRTQCKSDTDLEKTEFAFLCVLGNEDVQKHSYGQGGFDSEESYDSSVACDQCLGPNQAPQVALHASTATAVKQVGEDDKDKDKDDGKDDEEDAKAPAAAPAGAPAKKADKPKGLPVDLKTDGKPWKDDKDREKYLQGLVAKPPHNVSFYGPDNCVQTYLGDKGTCVMETKCKEKAIQDHELGLTCVEKDGKSARHLFGKNAFNPEEKFDTLIDCEICLGLDVAKLDKPMSIKDTISSLKTEVDELKKSMEGVSGDVKKLNEKVFPDAEKAPAPAPAALVHHSRERKTHHVKKVTEDEASEDQDQQETADVEEVDEEEAPKPRHHKAHKKHHKKKHHHKHRRAHHQEEYEEVQPVEEVVQEVKEDQPADDADAQPAAADDESSDNSDGW